jgi:uncharacterized membrane protein YccF (DUF307 family)
MLPRVTDYDQARLLRLDRSRLVCHPQAVAPILYTLFVGIPLCLIAVTFGLLACLTIVGIPLGITLIALGVKALSYPAPTRYDVRLYQRR